MLANSHYKGTTMTPDPIKFDFKTADFADYTEHLTQIISHQRQQINDLTKQSDLTWDNFMQPLEAMDNELDNFFTPLSHLNSVCNSEITRETYNKCIPILSEFATECGQNIVLFTATETLSNHNQNLNNAQRKILEHSLRDFRLSGVDLPPEQKKQYQELAVELSLLTTKFEENVLDSTDAWSKHVEDVDLLSGLPDHALAAAKQAAEKKKLTGYLLTLQAPCYIAVIQYADNRELRQEMHRAFSTRASDQGPHDHQYDNTTIIQDILEKRLQIAQLLNFNNYSEKSIATKMVKDCDQVLDFLWELVEKSKSQAKKEYLTLKEFAKNKININALEAWDVAYASEKLKQEHFSISDQELRPYFPAPKVIEGLFAIVSKLFDIQLKPIQLEQTWHPDTTCYSVSKNDEIISYIYFDLYARQGKRNGAWMTDAQNKFHLDSHNTQIPIAFVTCNFNPPTGDSPALLSHSDVITLFHEFGHALQHMLTEISYLGVSGINGVPWDAVEICSQFLENWAWQNQCMPLISSHFETQEPLPQVLLERMQAARHFQSALQMLRQLEFSIFDFTLHQQFDPNIDNHAQILLDEVREKVSVAPVPDYNKFQNAFSHIFAGGYAAGYYSYKWAEVMAADAFAEFLEKDIFDPATSKRFQETFLASGGAVEPLDLFIQFRGREPKIDALLVDCGIK
jgi:oligopeptidase A